MFDIGSLYAIDAAVAAIVIFIIFLRLMSTKYKELIDKPFCLLLAFFFVFCVVDMFWGALTSDAFIKNRTLYIIFTYLFHVGAAFSAFVWAGYVISYVRASKRERIILNIFRIILISIQLEVLISNIWTGVFFTINEQGEYEPYELRQFMFFLQFAYYISLIIFAIIRLLMSNKLDIKNLYKSAFVFSFIPLAFGVLQMLFPIGPMYSLGFMVTAIVIYSYNVTGQRENFITEIYKNENEILSKAVSGLSDDFKVVCLVNLDTEEYEVVSDSDEYMPEIKKKIEGESFFGHGIDIIKSNAIPTDCIYLTAMLSKRKLSEELENKNSFRFNYMVCFGDEYGPKETKYYMVKVIKSSMYEEKKEIIVGVFDDNERIQEEVRQKQELADAVQKAESASRAKTDFLFNMSHDIRTPMNAILGFNALAKKRIDEREYLEECLDKVQISGEHLLSLINDILDMSRIESNKLELRMYPEAFKDMFARVFSVTENLADGKSVRFYYDFVNIKNEFVLCDELRINQVLLNILSNSVKYTNPGGKVECTIEQIRCDRKGYATYQFKVKDTGIGMDKEFLEKIFDEFERDRNAAISGIEGTGLGMSIVKRLIELMNGTIKIDSKLGVGTTVEFVLTLAITNKQPEKRRHYIEKNRNFRCEGRKVLLVDDNEMNREIARELLEEMKMKVDEAADGTDAIKMVTKNGPKYYDVILMDVQMPLMDGYTATRKIRSMGDEYKAIPIFAMTANAFEEDKQNALEAGMNTHLTKPIDIPVFIDTMKLYLQ